MRRKTAILLFFIVLLAGILRFFLLGANPPSLDWDEASLGYNAYSLLLTGKDEYGSPWPLSIRSFNDYKPPLYTYLSIVPIAFWGISEFSIRFTSAFFGTLAVLISFFLFRQLFPKESIRFLLLAALFFAVSPWHIQFSRVAFEANVAQTFVILGTYLFLKGFHHGIFFLFSFLSYGASIYAYHSPRLFIPLFLVFLMALFWRKLAGIRIWYIAGGFLIFLSLAASLVFSLRSSTSARFGSVTVLNPNERLGRSIEAIEYDEMQGDLLGKFFHNRRIVYAREILAGYLDHFNMDYLFFTGDAPARHHAAGMGMLYVWDIPFLLVGLFFLFQKRTGGVHILFAWFFLAPLASAFTTGTPHAVRSYLYLPTHQILIAYGFTQFLTRWKQRNNSSLFLFFVCSLFLLNMFYYLHMYYMHTPLEHSRDWQFGYKEVVYSIRNLEANYSKILITYRYDQPYVYFLLYNAIDPAWYQRQWDGGEIKRDHRAFGKYEFRPIIWEKDANSSNTLIVGTPDEIPEGAPGLLQEIYFLDGSVAFRIVGR